MTFKKTLKNRNRITAMTSREKFNFNRKRLSKQLRGVLFFTAAKTIFEIKAYNHTSRKKWDKIARLGLQRDAWVQKSLEHEPNLSDLGCEPAKTQSQLQKPKEQNPPLLRPPVVRKCSRIHALRSNTIHTTVTQSYRKNLINCFTIPSIFYNDPLKIMP